MFRILDIAVYDVIGSLAVALVLILLGLALFRIFWIRKVAFIFPAGNFPGETPSFTNTTQVVTQTFTQHFACLFRRIFPLNREYWTHHAGFDGRPIINKGYCYLRFQRGIIFVMLVYSAVNAVIFAAFWMYIFID